MEPAAEQEPDRAQSFGVGWMTRTSVTTWLATTPVWLPVALVAFLPMILLQIWSIEHPLSAQEAAGSSRYVRMALSWLALLGGSTLTSAALCYAVVRRLQGGGLALLESLLRGLSRLPHSLGVGLVFVGIGVVAVLGAAWLSRGLGDWSTILMGILWLWLMAVWGLALPAAVSERLPVGASLGRSAALTRRRRWVLLLAWLLLWIILSILLTVLTGGERSASEKRDRREDPVASRAEWEARAYRRMWTATGILGLTSTLMAVSVGVAYFGLRREKDGVTFGELVKAFE